MLAQEKLLITQRDGAAPKLLARIVAVRVARRLAFARKEDEPPSRACSFRRFL
jgi:hypothetical protein